MEYQIIDEGTGGMGVPEKVVAKTSSFEKAVAMCEGLKTWGYPKIREGDNGKIWRYPYTEPQRSLREIELDKERAKNLKELAGEYVVRVTENGISFSYGHFLELDSKMTRDEEKRFLYGFKEAATKGREMTRIDTPYSFTKKPLINDYNGKPIYEGDILQASDFSGHQLIVKYRESFCDYCLMYECRGKLSRMYNLTKANITSGKLIIVGNIREGVSSES